MQQRGGIAVSFTTLHRLIKGQGRCFTCGSDQHRQQDCNRPKSKGNAGESSSNSEKGKGVDGGSGSRQTAAAGNPETRKIKLVPGVNRGQVRARLVLQLHRLRCLRKHKSC